MKRREFLKAAGAIAFGAFYAEVEKEYPQGVVPAYDGLEVSV